MSAINKPVDPVIYFPEEITLKVLSFLDESEKSVCAQLSNDWYNVVVTCERNELHKVVTDVFNLMKPGSYPVEFKESLQLEIKSTTHGSFKNLTEKFAVKYSLNFPISTSRLLENSNFEKIELSAKSKAIFYENLRVIVGAQKFIEFSNKKTASPLDVPLAVMTLYQSTRLCMRLNVIDEFLMLLEKNDLSTIGGKCNFTAMYRTFMEDGFNADLMLTVTSKLTKLDFKKYVLKDVFNALRNSNAWYKMMNVGARAVWLDVKVGAVYGLYGGMFSNLCYKAYTSYHLRENECKVSEFNEVPCSKDEPVTDYFSLACAPLGLALGSAYGTFKGIRNLLGEKQW